MITLDYQKKINDITDWIRERVASSPLKNVVIGLSGGIDSALSATLAVQSLGKEHVYVVLLPYGELNTQGVEDAHIVIEHLGLAKDHVYEIDIKSSVDVILNSFQDLIKDEIPGQARNDVNIRKGNIMARVRMVYLFDLAKKLRALVCGTENKTEQYLGYFTRFGDAASDIEPIVGLYKTHVWELAKHLGIPEKIITKAPTAGLWESQTDEGELGFSYKNADEVLSAYFDEKLDAVAMVEKGIKEEVVAKVLARVAENDFKHKLPYFLE